MPTIKLQIKNKIISFVEEINFINYNKDYEVEFLFDEEWQKEKFKTARFTYGKYVEDVVFENNKCDFPFIQDASSVGIGVYAGDLRSTNTIYINCIQSVLSKNGFSKEPSKDVYGQIIDLLNKYIEQGGGGGINREEVERIIDEYLTENPPKDGIDGFSPTITTTAIENGTRVEITDIDGTKSFDVLNGRDGTEILVGAEIKEVEETQTLVIELKDKQGNVISSAEVVLPKQETTDIDLSGYVKKTDYAKDGGSHGLVKINQSFGLYLPNGSSEALAINRATDEHIKNRGGVYRPLTSGHIDLIVKEGLTNSKLTWTEEEKARARALLGIE
jgi:hypothetical protein